MIVLHNMFDFLCCFEQKLNDRRTDIWYMIYRTMSSHYRRLSVLTDFWELRSSFQMPSLFTEMAWTGRNHHMSRLRWVEWADTNFSDIHKPISSRTNLTDYHILCDLSGNVS